MAGLCVAAALSVMAFAAASAQAEEGSHWNVSGSAISDALVTAGVVPQATLENNHGELLGKALGKPLKILCTAVAFVGARLLLEGGSGGKVRFTGCRITTLEGGALVVLPACEPHTGTELGVVETVALKDLIVLHEGAEGYDRLEPVTGTKFVNISTSSKCAFGENIPIITETGKGFVFKDCNLEGRVEKVTHLVSEGPLTKLWVISKTEEHESTIDGSANVILVGAHEGLKWSGTPR